MAVVHIRINGREYDVACDNGQEEHLRLLADELDERVRSLVFGMGSNPPSETMGLLLAALTMADEVTDNKKEIEKITGDLRRLSALVDEDKIGPDHRMVEIENAMAITLEEIAQRIEKIAGQIEVR